MKNRQSGKTLRSAFVRIIDKEGIKQEDLETFRRVGKAMALAEQQTADRCGIGADKCVPGDCGYHENCGAPQELGCGNDEQCRVCDSCMVLWDTCSSAMTPEHCGHREER